MKICHWLYCLAVSSLSLFSSIKIQAQEKSTTELSHVVDNKLFRYQGPVRYFAEAGGGGMKSGDFEGIELSASAGFNFGQSLNHALALEYLYADLHTKTCFANLGSLSGITDSQLKAAGKCRLKEYMLMLNYRISKTWGKNIKIPCYVGIGTGINLMEYDDYSLQVNISSDGKTRRSIQKKSTLEPEPVGQVFAGIGIQLTNRLSIAVRGRVLLTKTEKVRLGNTTCLRTAASSDHAQYAAELVLSIIL